jgi:NADPH:quinone reductase-like Zn-dependent oxidoreductase
MMRGWVHISRGTPSQVLSFSESLPLPTVKSPNHVLIKVRHAALNPGASVFMQLCPGFMRSKPSIPEMDFAGELVSLGQSVPLNRGLKPGVEVFGSVSVGEHLKGQGALGEYVVVGAEGIELAPQNLPLWEAAGLPIAGCTALSLLDSANLRKGQKVLVNGAAGGIGCFITQMVRDVLGPDGHILAVSSQEKAALLKELGADEVRA